MANTPLKGKFEEASVTWTTLTPQNSWVNIDSPAVCYKDSIGKVHLRFALMTGTSGTVALVLPVGSRPPYLLNLIGSDPSNNTGCTVSIMTNGEVRLYNWTGGDITGDGAYFEGSFSTVA